MTTDLLWLSGYPSHYTRQFHLEIRNRWGNQVEFLYLTSGRSRTEREYERGTLPPGAHVLSAGSLVEIWQLVARLSPRRVLVSGHFPRGVLLGALWAKLRGRRFYYWSDTNLLDILRRSAIRRLGQKILYRPILSAADRLLFIGTRNRDFYLWLCGKRSLEGKLRRLQCPAVLPPPPAKREPIDERLGVLYLGRLAPEKGLSQLVSAIRMLPESILGGTRITLAGSGPMAEELQAEVEAAGLNSVVDFAGLVASDEVSDLFEANDVLVLPSSREAWGLVINEALAAGLCVLAPYWVGSVADLVVDGANGLVLADNRPGTISRGIEKVFEDKNMRASTRRVGPKIVREGGWSLEGAVRSFSQLISEGEP